ncbi:MAG: Two-component response regulator [Labilithrix sp.]|nr:Two-component response regulator [Labilithrix sp.]
MASSTSYICIVDDDDDIREALRCALELSGYRVAEAADGSQALELLRSEEGCGLILLDLMMPTMNGWEFRALQREDRTLARIPVVVLSGVQDSPGTAVLAASVYVRKPIDLERLSQIVATQFKPRTDDVALAGP